MFVEVCKSDVDFVPGFLYFFFDCSPRIVRLSIGAFIEAVCTQLEDRARKER